MPPHWAKIQVSYLMNRGQRSCIASLPPRGPVSTYIGNISFVPSEERAYKAANSRPQRKSTAPCVPSVHSEMKIFELLSNGLCFPYCRSFFFFKPIMLLLGDEARPGCVWDGSVKWAHVSWTLSVSAVHRPVSCKLVVPWSQPRANVVLCYLPPRQSKPPNQRFLLSRSTHKRFIPALPGDLPALYSTVVRCDVWGMVFY